MKIEEVQKIELPKPPSVEGLILAYKVYGGYRDLALKSQKDYDYYLMSMRTSPYGKKPIECFTPLILQSLYNDLKKTNGVASANQLFSIMRVVYTFAQSKEWIQINPFKIVSLDTLPSRDVTWTREQVQRLIDGALEDKKDFVAKGVALMYDTGQRPGDILKLTFDKVKRDKHGWYLDFYQEKTGTRVMPSVSEYCAELVGFGSNVASDTRLVGGSYGLAVFRATFKLISQRVGLSPNLQLRDLRRTAICESGAASDDQMKAMSGHKTRAMLDTYSPSTRLKAHEAFKVRNLDT